MTRTVYVSIGNSDDKLTQAEWARFFEQVDGYMSLCVVHGRWMSAPESPYQNACWCIEVRRDPDRLKQTLSRIAGEFGQDSIAWAEAETEFLKPDA